MTTRSSLTQAKPILCPLLFLIFSFGAMAQEGAYWQGLQTKNPAATGTPSDWVFGSYHFSDLEKIVQEENLHLTGFIAGADYNISPEIGTAGVIFASEKMGNENVTQMEFSYTRTLPLNKGTLSVGVLAGLQNLRTKNSLYSSDDPYGYGGYSYEGYGYGYGYGGGYYPQYQYNYDSREDDYIEDNIFKSVKTGVGLFYNSEELDLGISAAGYFEIDKTFENVQHLNYASDFITVLGAYRFLFDEKLVIEPNLMIDFYKDRIDTYSGIFCEFRKQLWAGYSVLNLNDLHSLTLGTNIAKKFRLGYSYSFTDLFDSSGLNLHEFMLGYRIN